METKPREIVSDSEIRKNVLSMIIPVSIEGILQMISSTVLMAFLGRVDVLAVNAVGIGQQCALLTADLFQRFELHGILGNQRFRIGKTVEQL